ncbi:MAG: hypothetical protein HY644_03230, partial [Acidobacteria bacterium]|nr:hypothetical protein [Acidobacteriota bacterium]
MTDQEKTQFFQRALDTAARSINSHATVVKGRYRYDRMEHVFDLMIRDEKIQVISYSKEQVDDFLAGVYCERRE